MTYLRPLFAQDSLPVDIVPAPWQKMDAATKEILIILGSLALVTLLALIWAVAYSKRRQRSHRHSHHHHHHAHEQAKAVESRPSEESQSGSGSERRRRHRRRREHRPRNPTLAETGGLPPVRTSRPADPYP